MNLIGQVTIPGSIVCAFCGKGDECQMSGFKSRLIDSATRASDYKYPRVEDQQEVCEEAGRIGRLMGERLK